MKNISLKTLCYIFSVLLIVFAVGSAYYIGFGLGALTVKEPVIIEEVEPISSGENGYEVYTIEIWDDGSVRIITGQGYINRLSENIIIVTDQSLDYVQEEIRKVQDE